MALLSACRAPWTEGISSSPASPGTGGDTAATGESTDVALLRSVLEEVTTILALVTDSPEAGAASAMSRALRPVHAAHLAALKGARPTPAPGAGPSPSAAATPAPSSSATVPPKAAAARATILAAENVHLAALTTAAGHATSGGFARLLTSMAAGLAQHLTLTSPGHVLAQPSLAPPVLDASAPTVRAVQELLAAEHAALHVLGVLAGRARGTDTEALGTSLRTTWSQHRDLRDQVEGLLRAAGVSPVAAAPEYALAGPAVSASQITAIALGVQQRCTAVRAALVSHAEVGPVRSWAIALTNESAVRELSYGGNPVTFPGAA